MPNYIMGTENGSVTTSSALGTGTWYEYTTPYYEMPQQPVVISTPIHQNKKKGDDDMRYLYEVILVNPKNDDFYMKAVVARSETSALMKVYNESPFGLCEEDKDCVSFDDLKTSCRILMEWKKEKSLKKAIETIKKAVE